MSTRGTHLPRPIRVPRLRRPRPGAGAGRAVEATDATSFSLAAVICVVAIIGMTATSAELIHWFVIPVYLCGVLVATDAIDWLRGRVALFDPVGLVGLLGVVHFFLAPLLHVYWDQWLAYVAYPPDWREWLGRMALLNLVGLLLYRWARARFSRPRDKPVVTRVVHPGRFRTAAIVAIIVSGIFSAYLYMRFGGFGGVVDAYSRQRLDAFEGLGWAFLFADSFPILLLFVYAMWARKSAFARSWAGVAGVVIAVMGLRFAFDALRGSRSALVWAAVWVVGVIHLWVRRVPRQIVAAGMVVIFIAIYFLALYKGVGAKAVGALQSSAQRSSLEQQTAYDPQAVLLFDMARSSVQAYLLFRLTDPGSDYEYAWGRTYLAGATVLVPRAVWADRPVTKTKEATEALYGPNAYISQIRESSFVFGVAGEPMLNFGWIAAPIALGLMGVLVGAVRRHGASLSAGDPRKLLYPFLVTLCLVTLISDSDNIFSYLIQNGLLPFLVIRIGSTKLARQTA
jgi:hypothetical protein